jgi:hypothetical protein
LYKTREDGLYMSIFCPPRWPKITFDYFTITDILTGLGLRIHQQKNLYLSLKISISID